MDRPRLEAIRRLGTSPSGRGLSFDDQLPGPSRSTDSAEDPWLRDVLSGVVRWRGRIGLVIDSLAIKKSPTGWLRRALEVAVYQLIAQDRVAPAIVIDETVQIIKEREGIQPARFANAMLRRVSEQRESWRGTQGYQASSAQERAAWASLPLWIWSEIEQRLGPERAARVAQAWLERPLTHYCRLSEPEVERSSLGGDVRAIEGFVEGAALIQDLSSQRALTWVSAELKRRGVTRVIDLCAAPGGKTVGLAWRGFEVIATDRAPDRLELLRSSLARTRGVERVRVVEWEEALTAIGAVDASRCSSGHETAVWIDAPCSSSGIVGRHPDIRWHPERERELGVIRAAQRSCLETVVQRTRPGQLVVYSVCSVMRSEGEGALEPWTGELRSRGPEWQLAIWPDDAGRPDGFFVALRERQAVSV